MDITRRLSIQYAKKLLPHYHLERYKAIFKEAEEPGFEKELLFVLDEKTSNFTHECDYHTIRFLFSQNESLFQDLDNGLDLDITEDINRYLINIKCLDKEKEHRRNRLNY